MDALRFCVDVLVVAADVESVDRREPKSRLLRARGSSGARRVRFGGGDAEREEGLF